MVTKPSPTMLRRQLGTELRRLREGARRTGADVAQALGWSESKLSRLETGVTGIRNTDLTRLLALYGVGETHVARLHALAVQSRQRAWWEAYGDALLDPYETYIGFEAEAATIFAYEPLLVPALLQTVEYASSVIQVLSGGEPPDVVGQRVAVRMAKQAVLSRDPPPRLWTIIDEAALRRPIGGADIMRRQLMRLLEVGGQPAITIQVLPFSVGAHRGLDGAFVILEFPQETDQPLVYCEGMTGGVFRNKPDELRRYWMSFEAVRGAALSPEASTDFIAGCIHSTDSSDH